MVQMPVLGVRRKVGRVGFNQKPVARDACRSLPHPNGIFEGQRARKREIPPAPDQLVRQFRTAAVAVEYAPDVFVPQDRFKAVAVRLAVVNDYRQVQFLCQFQLGFKKVHFLPFVQRNLPVMFVVIVQPDLPQRHDFIAFPAGGVAQDGREVCQRGIAVRQIVAVLRMNPDRRKHAGILCRLRDCRAGIFGVGTDVDDMRYGMRQNRLQNRVCAAGDLRCKAAVEVVRVGVKDAVSFHVRLPRRACRQAPV